MGILFQNAKIWTPEGFLSGRSVLIKGDRIAEVGETISPEGHALLNAGGKMLLPGLVDLHTHGRGGYDFTTATEAQMKEMKRSYARQGVTTLFPTLASAPTDAWKKAIARIEAAGFDGIHLEGRYLNPVKRGAHALRLITPPNASELQEILENVHIPCRITAALELDEDGSFLRTALERGASVGLGHTNATAEEARALLKRGMTFFTHLFNAMPPIHHRDGGPVTVALTGRGFSELIADGFHVCPDIVKLSWKCLGKNRLVLITDSMEATGAPDGKYSIAGQAVVVQNREARTLDGTIAGSTLELWQGVKNLMKFTGAHLGDAVTCATLTPARAAGLDSQVGSIQVGKRADLLLVDENLNLLQVMQGGELIDRERE